MYVSAKEVLEQELLALFVAAGILLTVRIKVGATEYGTEEGGVCDLCSGGVRVESRPGHRLC
jgi:hypothetical protein